MSDFNFYELLKLIIPQIGILVLVYMFLNHGLERDNISQSRKRKDEFNKLVKGHNGLCAELDNVKLELNKMIEAIKTLNDQHLELHRLTLEAIKALNKNSK